MENMGFVNDVNSLISQLGCVPGALLSENYMKSEDGINANPNRHEPICHGNSVSAHSSGKYKMTDCTLFSPEVCDQPCPTNAQVHSPQASGNGRRASFSFSNPKMCQKSDPKNGQQTAFGSFSANYDPLRLMEQHILSDAFLGDNVNDTMMSQIIKESHNAVSSSRSIPDAHFSCTRVGKHDPTIYMIPK